MSAEFTRFKLRMTTNLINASRNLIDAGNIAINYLYQPFGRAVDLASNQYPFIGACVLSFGIFLVPVVFYGTYMDYRNSDRRRQLERERVELCLQKGIDPFPMIRYKANVLGNLTQLSSFSPDDVPLEASYERRSVDNMKRKIKLYNEVMGLYTEELDTEGNGPLKGNITTIDDLIKLREREKAYYNRNKAILWHDPVDLAFPRREDELYPANSKERAPPPSVIRNRV